MADPGGSAYDDLFDELVLAPHQQSRTIAEIHEYVKSEFSGGTDEQKSRAAERAEIEAEIASHTRTLRKHRNVRNLRQTPANQKRADKRRAIKNKITELRLRLADIEVEIENER